MVGRSYIRCHYSLFLFRQYVLRVANPFNTGILRTALVGVVGFGPTAPCSQSTCASQTALHPDIYDCQAEPFTPAPLLTGYRRSNLLQHIIVLSAFLFRHWPTLIKYIVSLLPSTDRPRWGFHNHSWACHYSDIGLYCSLSINHLSDILLRLQK